MTTLPPTTAESCYAGYRNLFGLNGIGQMLFCIQYTLNARGAEHWQETTLPEANESGFHDMDVLGLRTPGSKSFQRGMSFKKCTLVCSP